MFNKWGATWWWALACGIVTQATGSWKAVRPCHGPWVPRCAPLREEEATCITGPFHLPQTHGGKLRKCPCGLPKATSLHKSHRRFLPPLIFFVFYICTFWEDSPLTSDQVENHLSLCLSCRQPSHGALRMAKAIFLLYFGHKSSTHSGVVKGLNCFLEAPLRM